MKSAIKESLDELSKALVGGAFPDDLKIVGSWAKQLKQAELQDRAFKNPALKGLWAALLSERDAMNNLLLRAEKLEDRGVVFKYRNLLDSLYNAFAGAEARGEAIEKNIVAEAEHINSPGRA